jgi:hypothetical protein
MEGRKNTPPRPPRAKSKTPAERSEEFTATQRRLKDEATARREEGRKSGQRKR